MSDIFGIVAVILCLAAFAFVALDAVFDFKRYKYVPLVLYGFCLFALLLSALLEFTQQLQPPDCDRVIVVDNVRYIAEDCLDDR